MNDGVSVNNAAARIGVYDTIICMAHTLQLAVNEALDLFDPFISAVRRAVTFFKQSVLATKDLLTEQSRQGV